MIVINPGSKITGGTKEQAIKNAKLWLSQLRNAGIRNVEMWLSHRRNAEMTKPVEYIGRCRWRFIFRHKLTGVEATLDIHGYTDEEVKEYANGNIFKAYPRVYWNGCSSSEPCLEDFLAKGFHIDIVKD